MSKKDNWPTKKIGPSKQAKLKEKWDNMNPEERRAASRRQLQGFLKMCQGADPIMVINGKPQEHSPMSEEEANLHLALFDGEIEPTAEIRLELAQLEAARWPNNKKLQAKMWKIMAEIEEEK